MAPGLSHYGFTANKATCVIGRSSLYPNCDVLYDQGARNDLLPVNRVLFLPDVTEQTEDFMGKPLSKTSRKLFHYLEVRDPENPTRLTAHDRHDKQQGVVRRTDYALIQRFYLRHAGVVVVLAGCTALGTLGAATEAQKFSRTCLPHISPNDSVEILLKVDGSGRADKKGNLIGLPWKVTNCVPLGVYVNFKAVAGGRTAVTP